MNSSHETQDKSYLFYSDKQQVLLYKAVHCFVVQTSFEGWSGGNMVLRPLGMEA